MCFIRSALAAVAILGIVASGAALAQTLDVEPNRAMEGTPRSMKSSG